MKRDVLVGVVSALALALAACGGSTSPASPSSPPASSPATQAGATISGSVSGATTGSATGYRALDAGNGVTVTIAGTNLTVATDGQGRFTFTGIPAGTVSLVFTAGGGSATLTLAGVQANDRITIRVTLRGTTATLDDEERNGSTMTELEDRITAINPAGTTRTIDVGATRVSVPAAATIRHGGTDIDFAALKVGDRVHVRGATSGAQMIAAEVMVQNTNTNVAVNASGSVSGLQKIGAGCPTIQFVVGGGTVETSAVTDFQKAACGAIANGTSVHVKGDVQQASGRVLATWVQAK
jgi:hypothetical protein